MMLLVVLPLGRPPWFYHYVNKNTHKIKCPSSPNCQHICLQLVPAKSVKLKQASVQVPKLLKFDRAREQNRSILLKGLRMEPDDVLVMLKTAPLWAEAKNTYQNSRYHAHSAFLC